MDEGGGGWVGWGGGGVVGVCLGCGVDGTGMWDLLQLSVAEHLRRPMEGSLERSESSCSKSCNMFS